MLGSRVITLTPAIDTAIYASGDALGGKLFFPLATAAGLEAGRIISATIIDLDKQQAPIDLMLFDRNFTETANNAPWAPSNADLAFAIGFVRFVAGDYGVSTTAAIASLRNLIQGYNLMPGVLGISGQMVVRGTPTYTAAGNLTVKLCLQIEA